MNPGFISRKAIKATALLIGLFVFTLTSQPTAAHASIDQRIAALSKKLEHDPDSIELYLLRGELYASHEEWIAAAADYDQVLKLEPANLEVHFFLGRMYLLSGHPRQALKPLKHYLQYRPEHGQARITLAKTLHQLGYDDKAVIEYTLGIKQHAEPDPDWYLQRARIQSALGVADLREAIVGLDQGIERLGWPVSLQLFAISLELRSQQYDAALARLNQVMAQSPRKERWLLQRAEILLLAGRKPQALEASKSALAALHSLAQHKQETEAMRGLEARILTFQASLNLDSEP